MAVGEQDSRNKKALRERAMADYHAVIDAVLFMTDVLGLDDPR